MGFFKKQTNTSSYPARRNRHHHPATVNPPAPSNYGAHNPTPMPASVYQANGMPVAPAAAATAAPASTAAPYNYNAPAAAAAYGAFPGNNAPVQATVYVPGQGGASPAVISTAAPVMATAYVPGASPVPATTAVHAAAAPVQASVYQAPGNHHEGATAPPPPPMNPQYGRMQSQQRPSFNNGNCNYNTNESSFWECSVCTFPNMRTEPNCKGCGSPIPPGMLQSAASAAAMHQQHAMPPQDTSTALGRLNSQIDSMSLGGAKVGAGAPGAGGAGVMRVHIPNGMRPGQIIKVRSPDGSENVKTIPPESEWQYDGARPFFRMQYGSSPAAATGASPPAAHEVPPPHSTTWREFYNIRRHYSAPPLALRSVPSRPIGSGLPLPPNGRHKCLVIGINYTGSRAALRGCINDARNMQGLLKRNGFPDDGSHMLLLTDERSRGGSYQPTNENVIKAFAWLMKDVRKGDVLFFHFSGHGGQQPDKTGMEVDGFNETLIPVDYERKGQISDDVLWGSLVYPLPEGARITALMDMCHSGTGLDLPYDYNLDTRRWKEDVNPAHSAGDVVLFSGCEDAQTSADVSGGYGSQAGGAMTQAFMGAYDTCNGRAATYHEFLVAVRKQLRRKKFSQRPQLTSSQQFDANSRIFSLGYASGGCGGGAIPSVIEPNHNPKVGRMKRRHVRPARDGRRGGGDLFGFMGAAVGAALIADALF